MKKMNKYLTATKPLVNHIYWFYEDINLKPRKKHYGSSINYSDIKERKDDFLAELINTIVSWVYNHHKVKALCEERCSEVNDFANAMSFVVNQAYNKFRPGFPQGQFGELLLFNLIQHYYEAVPVLRKQHITTSNNLERFGADAIHYKKINNKNVILLGESKCYVSKYSFKKAFEKSLHSIVNSFENLDRELNLYLHDDFIEPELVDIVKAYKNGTLENVEYELVCLIIYNEGKSISGECEKSIKNNIKKVIMERCNSFENEKFNEINSTLLSRINYIIFPIWELDELLKDFQRKVGSI